MLRFLLKRILFFIPVLGIVVLLAFGLSTLAPSNPLDKILESEKTMAEGSVPANSLQKQYWIKKLGLDLPLFYIDIKPLSYSNELQKVYDKDNKILLNKLIAYSGNSFTAISFCKKLNLFIETAKENKQPELIQLANQLKYSFKEPESGEIINELIARSQSTLLEKDVSILQTSYTNLISNKTIWKNFVPTLRFYSHNRFHQWLFGNSETDEFKTQGILKGDFGVSYATREPVIKIVKSKLPWTLFFSCTSIVLAFFIGISFGTFSFLKREGPAGIISDRIFFLLISIPVFVIAIGLIYALANPDFINVLPSSGIKPVMGFSENDGLFSRTVKSIPFLVIPLICYTYGSVAYLSLFTKNLLSNNSKTQYMLTARAKGLSEKKAVLRHSLQNALNPLITVFGNVFPSVLAGSIVLETIFTIPGMGYQTWYAIQNQDYPFITCVVLLTGLLTVIGFLVADVLSYFADPRLSLSEKK